MSQSDNDESARVSRASRVKEHMQQVAHLKPSDENKAYITYLISRSQAADLPGILLGLEEQKSDLGITDVQVRSSR